MVAQPFSRDTARKLQGDRLSDKGVENGWRPFFGRHASYLSTLVWNLNSSSGLPHRVAEASSDLVGRKLLEVQSLAQEGLAAHAEDDAAEMWDAAGLLRALAPWRSSRKPSRHVCEAEAKGVRDILGATTHPSEQTELPADIYHLFWEVQDLAAKLRSSPDQSAEGCGRIIVVARKIEALLQEQGRVVPREVSRHWPEDQEDVEADEAEALSESVVAVTAPTGEGPDFTAPSFTTTGREDDLRSVSEAAAAGRDAVDPQTLRRQMLETSAIYVCRLNELANADLADGNCIQAKKYLEESSRIQRVLWNDSSDDLAAKTLAMLGQACLDLKDFVQARQYLAESWEVQRVLQSDSNDVLAAKTLAMLGQACLELKDFVQARQYLAESWEVQPVVPSDSNDVLTAVKTLAMLGQACFEDSRQASQYLATQIMSLQPRHWPCWARRVWS